MEEEIKQKDSLPGAPSDTGQEEELGYIEVADEVIGIVASLAAMDVPGVISMSTGFREGLNNLLGKKSPGKSNREKLPHRSVCHGGIWQQYS